MHTAAIVDVAMVAHVPLMADMAVNRMSVVNGVAVPMSVTPMAMTVAAPCGEAMVTPGEMPGTRAVPGVVTPAAINPEHANAMPPVIAERAAVPDATVIDRIVVKRTAMAGIAPRADTDADNDAGICRLGGADGQ